MAIERAVLSSAGEADLIHVRVEYRGSSVWPRCYLLEGPDAEAVRGTIGSREPPKDEGFTRTLWEEGLWDDHESVWADRSTTGKFLQDGGAADPRRTPFFVRCAGGNPTDLAPDVAHVSGTLVFRSAHEVWVHSGWRKDRPFYEPGYRHQVSGIRKDAPG